jgi:hypothetical protein
MYKIIDLRLLKDANSLPADTLKYNGLFFLFAIKESDDRLEEKIDLLIRKLESENDIQLIQELDGEYPRSSNTVWHYHYDRYWY